MGISIDIVPGATPDTTRVHAQGLQDLGIKVPYGALIAAMDVWQASKHDFDPYEIDPGPHWPIGVALPIRTTVTSDLQPVALATHLWDNLHGSVTTHYDTSLSETVTLTDTTTWTSELSATLTITAGVTVGEGPVKANASTTYSVTAKVGHTHTQTRTVAVGTTDGSSADLPVGKAELLVLTAERGPLTVTCVIQTGWQGSIRWRHKKGGVWQTVDMGLLMEHGLARPYDEHGIHDGITTLIQHHGTVSEVAQTAVAVPNDDPATLTDAVRKLLDGLPDHCPTEG